MTEKKLKILFAHPGMNTHIKQCVKSYETQDHEVYFFTTLYLPKPVSSFLQINIPRLYKYVSSRDLNIKNIKLRGLFIPEIIRLFASKFTNTYFTDWIWEISEWIFDFWVSINIDNSFDVVHVVEHASLRTLKRAKKLGVKTAYIQPSANSIFIDEQIIQPLMKQNDRFKKYNSRLFSSKYSLRRNIRRQKELELTDIVICASNYVKKTLIYAGVDASKIKVIPLGSPDRPEPHIKKSLRLNFISSGNISYLKGSHHIINVWKENQNILSNHNLILIGSNMLPKEEWENLPDNIQVLERLNHADYLEILRDCDVYLFNSYSDGFGMVMTEAMSNGLAVIATRNSAGPDLIEDKVNGLLINPGDESQLLESIQFLISNNSALQSIKSNSYKTSREYQWSRYHAGIISTINQLVYG